MALIAFATFVCSEERVAWVAGLERPVDQPLVALIAFATFVSSEEHVAWVAGRERHGDKPLVAHIAFACFVCSKEHVARVAELERPGDDSLIALATLPIGLGGARFAGAEHFCFQTTREARVKPSGWCKERAPGRTHAI